jgi:hypothetical protein
MTPVFNSIIFRNRIILVSVSLCSLFLIVGLLFVYVNMGKLASPLILNFDETLGRDFFGEVQSLWFLWITGLVVVFVNLFFGHFLFYRERTLSYLLFGITALLSLFHLVAIIRVISLN